MCALPLWAMYNFKRIRTIDLKGVNYLRPTSEGLALNEVLRSNGIDLNDKNVCNLVISNITIAILNDIIYK